MTDDVRFCLILADDINSANLIVDLVIFLCHALGNDDWAIKRREAICSESTFAVRKCAWTPSKFFIRQSKFSFNFLQKSVETIFFMNLVCFYWFYAKFQKDLILVHLLSGIIFAKLCFCVSVLPCFSTTHVCVYVSVKCSHKIILSANNYLSKVVVETLEKGVKYV